ncbi:MAG: tRNA pseudouridine(55) synthase TruB [Maricaulaceae bacterium]
MARRKKGNPVHGWVVLDKPLTMGSTSAVGKVRWLYTAQKAGHAGTLDPLATGVLPIALGEATKTVAFMMDAAKSYEFTVKWGENTSTWDMEGEVTAISDVRPSADDIFSILHEFTGEISQMPPKFSALKVDGKRAYDLARAGEDFALKARPVRIDHLDCVDATEHTASFIVDCGKGTYVRSLARDIAARLGTCGHVVRLRRTRVGVFDEKDSFSVDDLEKLPYEGRVLEALRPVKTVLDDIPDLAVTENDAIHLKHGRAIALSSYDTRQLAGVLQDAQEPLILALYEGKSLALCEIREDALHPKRVFNL